MAPKLLNRLLVALAGAFAVSTASAAYPERKLTMIVPFPPGGPTDLTGRIAAKAIEIKGGQPVIVENRPGAGGVIGLEAVANTPPDGYTLGLSANHVPQLPLLLKDYKGNLAKRLTRVVLVSSSPFLVYVRAEIPVHSVRGLIDYVKTNPGKVNYANASRGGPEMVYLFLEKKFDLKWTRIDYKGTQDLLPAFTRGDFQVQIGIPSGWLNLVDQGTIRVIGTIGPKRYPRFPDVPLLSEQGVPEFNGLSANWFGVDVPTGTSKQIIQTLAKWVTEYVRTGEGREQIMKLGATPEGSTPEQYDAVFKADEKGWGDIARSIGYKPQ
jgi:tripartite-type tricarboxylate transporter receptor subunit TctC